MTGLLPFRVLKIQRAANSNKALQSTWLHLAVATILSSPFFILTEEIVSSLGTLTETISNLLTFLTSRYLGVRQFH